MVVFTINGMRRTDNEGVTSISVSQSDLFFNADCADAGDLTSVCNSEEDNGAQAIDLPVFDEFIERKIVINMTNSSYVDIKPTTQFYAPVTIYKHCDTSSTCPTNVTTLPATTTESVNNKDKLETETNSSSRRRIKVSKQAILTNWKLILGIVLGSIIALIVIVTISFTVPSKNYEKNLLRPYPTVHPSPPLGEGVVILTKERWGGREMPDRRQNRNLSHPVELVIIGHTASEPCSSFDKCAPLMVTFQSSQIQNRKWGDIGYNFVIGGDGNVYEGLGWDITNYYRDNSIIISFIGNYVFDELKDNQRKAVKLLLKRGVELGKLASNYTLVGNSQIANTISPGKNLLADLKQWPHYYPGLIT